MTTRLSPRFDAAPQLLPFDKERLRRKRARWARVGQILAIGAGSLAVAAIVVMFLLLWVVQNDGAQP